MIHKISSSLQTFKTLNLKPGLNLLVADKIPGATQRDTRNGAGKSSLLEVIHFLLGADCDKDSIFRHPALREHAFRMKFDVAGGRVTVERSGQQPSRVYILDGDTKRWPIQPSRVKDSLPSLHVDEWVSVLGQVVFGLPEDPGPYGASFRSLISYFVRRHSAGGLKTPAEIMSKQQVWNKQVAVAYLLGLDWTIPQGMQRVRQQRKSIRDLREFLDADTVGRALGGTTSQLQTTLVLSDRTVEQLRHDIRTFRVEEQYHRLEEEANAITQRMGAIADENTLDREYVEQVEHAITDERPPSFQDLEKIYGEASVVIAESALRRFDDVKRFHESVVDNRRSYLKDELERTKRRIAVREQETNNLGVRSAQVMGVLKNAGALETFTHLQEELARVATQSELIRQRLLRLDQMQRDTQEMKIDEANLALRLSQDHREQAEALRRAILIFAETSRTLYKEGGELEVNSTLAGEPITVRIHAKRSAGISSMQIFCFDMMLMQLMHERRVGPAFLVHDSHLFDPADARQVGTALGVAARLAEKHKFQYLVTANTDDLEKLDFAWQPFALPTRLTDTTATGGLFGMHFE